LKWTETGIIKNKELPPEGERKKSLNELMRSAMRDLVMFEERENKDYTKKKNMQGVYEIYNHS
jgi:hypothetical protein